MRLNVLGLMLGAVLIAGTLTSSEQAVAEPPAADKELANETAKPSSTQSGVDSTGKPSNHTAASHTQTLHDSKLESAAQKFISLLREEKFAEAVARFDATMQQAMPAAQLQAAWRAATITTGAFQRFEPCRINRVAKWDVVDTACVFEMSTVVIRMSFDAKQQVGGLFFLPPTNTNHSADAGSAVQLRTATGTLFGSLDRPAGHGPWPIVLIIAGSGPTDRDGNSPPLRNDSLKLLGKALAAKGVAALRYDKRGIGESASAIPAEEKLRFENFVDDAAGWVKQLRGDSRFSRIAILGHSEGSLIGILAAKQVPIDALISVAGAGRDVATLLREQLKRNLPPELFEKSTHIFDELAAGRRVDDVPPELNALFRPSVQPYLMSCFKFNPPKEIADVTIPILIVQGTTDIQVSIEDADLLTKANENARLATIEDMNHVLKRAHARSLLGQSEAYADPSMPLAPHLTDAIVSFLHETMISQQK
jgi:pimeloyl-ACP methyl ester carboxylesterase